MNNNIILKTDSYKLVHWKMYPKDTEYVYSYFESRKGASFNQTVFFGLQYILKNYLEGIRVTKENIDQAEKLCKSHFGNDRFFNKDGWNYILNNYGGKLPVRIKAVPEGYVVPVNNVMMTVENTDPKCAWLTNAIESILTHTWYSSTVATQSRECKKMFNYFLKKTSNNTDCVNFMLHDFGYRGVSSDESASIGGLAHLINFFGTDTLVGMITAVDFYSAKNDYTNLAYSVAATEHSIMTAKGKDGELEIVKEMIDTFPDGILSVVADSYDIYNFVENIVGKQLKDKILARNGVFVVRPDSITPDHPYPEHLVVWILNNLWTSFGGEVNSKGFKVLNPKIRVLWGDGLNMADIKEILQYTAEEKFSVENLVFGMGGGLLQKVNRDTQRFAFKSSAQCRDNVWYDIFKQPKDESKTSKKGKLKLVWDVGSHGKGLITVPETDPREDVLVTIFENGEIKNLYTFDEVRENAKMKTLEETFDSVDKKDKGFKILE